MANRVLVSQKVLEGLCFGRPPKVRQAWVSVLCQLLRDGEDGMFWARRPALVLPGVAMRARGWLLMADLIHGLGGDAVDAVGVAIQRRFGPKKGAVIHVPRGMIEALPGALCAGGDPAVAYHPGTVTCENCRIAQVEDALRA